MPKASAKANQLALVDEMGNFYADPLNFVRFTFPWGEKNTILSEETGPDEWQVELLNRIGLGVLSPEQAIQEAISSGHGVGKSALVAWLILWFMSTRPHAMVVVTANTETQLTTKTWRELAKWHQLAINNDWFEWSATQLKHVKFASTWFASAIPWSENRPEAFAGSHERHILMLFDEASAIPDIIWENAEGAMTTPGAMWFVFGNMTRSVGRFVDCFERFKHRWGNTRVDSRRAKKADQKKIAEWIADYGEDSDFVRVRVRGVKPRSGSKQFISHETVFNCHQYRAYDFEKFPKLMSVDVARSGECESVRTVRQGRKVGPQKAWRERDSMALAGYIAEELRFHRPQLCFIEGVGLGGPIVDRLRQLGWGDVVIEVNPGARLKDTDDCLNLRAQWWRDMKVSLEEGMELPEDIELDNQLTMVEYSYSDKMQLQIQKKEDMAYSPDRADGVALTFCHGNTVVSSKESLSLEVPVLGCV